MSASNCSRRTFLQCTTGGLAAGLAALGLPAELLASPRFDLAGARAGGEMSYPIPPGDSVNIDRANQVILVRVDTRVFAFALSCPHQNAAVKWLEKDHRFQCSKHDSKYQPDGVYTSGRATRNLDRFAIRREATAVVIDLLHVFHSDKEAAAWAAAVVTV